MTDLQKWCISALRCTKYRSPYAQVWLTKFRLRALNCIHSRKSYSFAYVLIWMLIFVSIAIPTAYAESLVAVPTIIDLKGKARDILQASVVLKNNSSKYVEVYPFVNNIDISKGQEVFQDPASADTASSLANWIELSRSSIVLKAGEERTIDFVVNVNLRAKPGAYHAVFAFARGSTRDEAQSRMASALTVPINLEVLDDAKERLQIRKFVPDKVFSSGFPVAFSIVLENVGNRAVTPTGEIRIYDRGGEEVAIVPIGTSVVSTIQPNATTTINVVWKGANINQLLASAGITLTGWGRYKALLDIEYGSSKQNTLNDTVFFWVVPWAFLLILFVLFTSVIIYITMRFHHRAKADHHE